MEKLSLHQIQEKEYIMLRIFATLCEKNNLRYGLAGGTLLGAVRHNGFIPWDDDIDVVMPRPDFYKLLEIADQELPQHYKLVTPYNDNDTFHAYGKICDLKTSLVEFPKGKRVYTHLYIDIFPVDGMPEGLINQGMHMKKTRMRMLVLYAFKVAKYKRNEHLHFPKNIFWGLIACINKLLPEQSLIKWVDSLATKFSFDDSKYRAVVVAGYGAREVMPHVVYQFNHKVLFEKSEFWTYSKPDYYLTNIYGDYMVLPPVDQRICHDAEVFGEEQDELEL